jgi:hypothetical protein
MVNAITWKNMSRHLLTFTTDYVNLWGMMRRIVVIMTSCTKDQEIHIGFKEKYNRNKILHSLILQEEETSTLVVDSKEEDEVEVWVEVKVISFVITMYNQDIWQGTFRTLVPLDATATHLNMLLNIVQHC